MSEQLMDVHPTRMELLALRKRMEIAGRGRDLLREKLDAMMIEFFEFVREISNLRAKAQKVLGDAYLAFTEAQMILGYTRLREISYGVGDRFDVIAKTRNVIGVSIPSLQVEMKPLNVLPYGMLDTTARLDEASLAMAEAIRILVELSAVEAAVVKLAEAIASVKRRVNSLEYVIIPRMINTIRYIRVHLEEREREDFFRLKMIKGRLRVVSS
ncbi:V-type ATP synthase subunit D [Candidatus Bathyarchaeota archaeon]|nr:V-type ATP synthase subunit D [Candidatus Bathyarchaeota archaeon]